MTITSKIISQLRTQFIARGWVQSLFLLYFGIFSIAMLAYTLTNPSNNWDMIAYVGSVKNFETGDSNEIHEYAYSGLREFVDDDTWTELTSSSNYRKTLYADPESFRQVLPWYQIRPVYTGLMYLLNKLGLNIYFSGYLVSALAVIAGLWVFYYAFRPYIASTLWFAVPFFIMLNGTVEDARLGTPDGLSFLYTAILTLYFLRRSQWLIILLPLAVCIRTDLIFLVAFFLGYLFIRERASRLPAILALLTTVVIYLTINKIAGNYGWATVFYLVFVSNFNLNYPADTHVVITLPDYMRALMNGTLDILQSDAFDAFVGLFALQIGILLRLKGFTRSLIHLFEQRINALALISFAYVIVHFLIFPAGISRFFAAQFLSGLLVFLALVNRVGNLKPSEDEF